MTDLLLKELDVTNFRSIRGQIYAPLDAQVVLVQGENGAGKTSLLSAIELALTGGIHSLERADPDYAQQLLHRSASEGSIVVTTGDDATNRYRASLGKDGARAVEALRGDLASFFSERSYLPQSLLGQLLQIYQDSEAGADSPLARFVGELLRLDRLDALEAGLKPLGDVRNVRKIADGWSSTEIEKARLDTLIKDQKQGRVQLAEEVARELSGLREITGSLGLSLEISERQLDQAVVALAPDEDEKAFAILTDQRRRLASIRREIEDASRPGALPSRVQLGPDAQEAFARWEASNGPRYIAIRARVEALLPEIVLPGDMAAFGERALAQLAAGSEQAAGRALKSRYHAGRLATAREELATATSRVAAIDEEIERIPTSAGSLSSLLSELTSSIEGEVCPVCNRDYGELGNGTLIEHVHNRVRTLSASAERLIALGRTRSETQSQVGRFQQEIATLERSVLDAKALANLDRRAVDLAATRAEVAGVIDVVREGARLRAADISARRAVTEAHARSVSLSIVSETLSQFAVSLGAKVVGEGESLEAADRRFEDQLAVHATQLEKRLSARRAGREAIGRIRAALKRRSEFDPVIAVHEESLKKAAAGLQRAQKVREHGHSIRNAVDAVRSAIIRREFNERLNRLWRDLFVRLAPGEPFVPAFRIPAFGTQRIQPKLVTEYRSGGDAGGSPGAMLSAGNLNTAALTLFLALHLSVPKKLPWLILDDPVQSMDDVHIAHLAALLRTISKEHGRQIIVAVHDRPLFEYLRLELSPAFPGDSLLTLELSRGSGRDTRCLSQRFSYQEETALLPR